MARTGDVNPGRDPGSEEGTLGGDFVKKKRVNVEKEDVRKGGTCPSEERVEITPGSGITG